MAASWSEFEGSAPEMAREGRRLLNQFGPGLGYLATVRPDGGPRLHPFCPTIAEGRLWAYIADSPKRVDLHRDGRYALHSFPMRDGDDEFMVRGVAETRPPDHALKQRIQDATEATIGTGDEDLFELRIERVLVSLYGDEGAFPPSYLRWAAPDA